MTDKQRTEQIRRVRMHGLYLSRRCDELETLASQLLGLHSWFYRNVCFSALIRGADITGWRSRLVKTWLYRGTLHGVAPDDLPDLLAVHRGDDYLERHVGAEFVRDFAEEVLRYVEDGVYSRAEFRKIFAGMYDHKTIEAMFSPWGGVFVHLARCGKVAFRDMSSRDFDLIDAQPSATLEEVLPGLFSRFIAAYGPATLDDAAWFFGLSKEDAKQLKALPLNDFDSFEYNRRVHYFIDPGDTADIPELTLLSGFDPLIVSYTDRSVVLPAEHKKKVILSSGICLPTVAVNGQVAGIWNIKGKRSTVDFFDKQPKRITNTAFDMVESIRWRSHL